MTDSQLRQDIIDELEFDPSLDAAHIGVAVDRNVVSLTGHASRDRRSRGFKQLPSIRDTTVSNRS